MKVLLLMFGLRTAFATLVLMLTGYATSFAQNTGYNPQYVGAGNGCKAGGTCYYIDYVGGSNTNNGLTKATAWKAAPGMKCATGNPASHSFSQTNEFIFKGGVTWPAGCFPWVIASGGASAPNAYAYPGMYLGYDPTWNTGVVNSVRVVDPGSCAGNTSLSVGFSGGGGSGVVANAQIETDPYALGDLQFVTVTAPGSGYSSNPTVSFTVSSGSCATHPTAYADIYSPIMDGAGTVFGTSTSITPMLSFSVRYGTLDHIEFKNYLWYAGPYSGGSPNMIGLWSPNIVAQNLYLHNFGMTGAANSIYLTGALNAAQTTAIYGGSPATLLTNSIFNNYETEVRGGCNNGYNGSCTQNTAVFAVPSVTNNVINAWRAGIYTVADVTSGYLVAGNKVWAILSDPATQHPDAFYLLGGTIAYNNILRDIFNGTAAFYIETSDGSTPIAKGMTTYLFNNVMFGIGTNGSGTSTPPIGWTSEFVSGGASSFSPSPDLRAYNNTFFSNAGGSACINAGQWYGNSPTLNAGIPFTLYNNFCVSSQATGHWFDSNGSPSPCSNGCGIWNGLSGPSSTATRTAVDLKNVSIAPTNAATQGYTSGNNFAPTATSNASVSFASGGNSQNLTSLCSTSVGGVSLAPLCSDIIGTPRPATGGWQAGAYHLVGTTPTLNPPTNLTTTVN